MTSLLQIPPRSACFRYGAAVLGIALVTGVRFAMNPTLGYRLPFLFFFLAIVPIAWHLGVGPSLLAIVLATVAAITLFIPPMSDVGLSTVTDLSGLALFVAVNLVIVWSAEVNRTARHRLEGEVQERIRAEAIILEQMHRAEFGRDIDLALTSGSSLDAVLERCNALTIRHLGGDHSRIASLPTMHEGERPGGDDLKSGLVGRIATERRPHLTNNLADDSGEFDRDRLSRVNMAALAGCPLVVEDRLVGVWLLYSKTSLCMTTLRAMESVAGSLALGIERHRAEEDLRAAKRDAEDANRAKDRFIAVLSHELRTPLNPISLSINSILQRPDVGDELRPDLELIRHYVGLEARLIDDLLDVMRIVRGKMPLDRSDVDAHQLIRQAVAICDEDRQAKVLDLILDLRAAHHAVSADPNRVCQVFWNLIKNAIKFTPSGGSIAIRTRNEPAARPGEPVAPANHRGASADLALYLVIEVADTGIGIEPEILPRIFDAFQQGDSTIVRQFGGLGLGLAICQGIVEGHAGSLIASSPGKGRGATFAVRLRALAHVAARVEAGREFAPGTARPAVTHFDPAADLAPAPVGSEPRSLRVLVVEDEPATIRLMSRLLRGLGYGVTAAESVAEATRYVDSPERFDLLVSDIGLPDGTGFDLMRRVRVARGALPAIALTGFGTEEDIEQSRQAGFAAHMTKPIDFNQLETLIRHVIAAPSARA